MATALDLFAGAGGWSLACERLGIDEVGVEIMPAALETRAAAGFKSHEIGDVWQFPFSEKAGRYEGLIASPPCQTFSTAGKGAGRKALDDVLYLISTGQYEDMDALREAAQSLGDERTALVLTPLHAAYAMRPKWLAWEQVPTVLPVWEACAEELRGLGYSVWTGNLQAEMYGVPQTRKRALLIASLEKEVMPPTPTHSRYYPRDPERLDPGVKKWVSMAEGLGWGLTKRPSYTITGGSGHAAASGIEWGGSSVREQMIALAELGMPDWISKRPATTVVGSFRPDVVAAPGYRTTVSRQNALDSVRVTVAEHGTLQSFPEDFPWQGSQGKKYLQSGNAVPPLLAEHVLRTVL